MDLESAITESQNSSNFGNNATSRRYQLQINPLLGVLVEGVSEFKGSIEVGDNPITFAVYRCAKSCSPLTRI